MNNFHERKTAAFRRAHEELRSVLFRTKKQQKELARAIGVTDSTLSGNLRAESFGTWEAIALADGELAPIAAVLHWQIALAFAGGSPVRLGQHIDQVGGDGLRAMLGGDQDTDQTIEALAAIREQINRIIGGDA